MITETACFTGHRRLLPEKLPSVSASLACAIAGAYDKGYRRFMCGGALGFDTLAALEVLKFRVSHLDARLVLVLPCEDQASRWPEKDRSVYRSIRDRADETVVLSPVYYHGCMQTRNRYMVDHSSLCICYLYSLRGGTAYTVRYAVFRDIAVLNLAMEQARSGLTLKENPCCSTFISPSAGKSAVTVLLFPSPSRKLRQKHTSACS